MSQLGLFIGLGGSMSLKVTTRHTCIPLNMRLLLSITHHGPGQPKNPQPAPVRVTAHMGTCD